MGLVANVESEDRSRAEVDHLEPGSTWTSIDLLCNTIRETGAQIGRCTADTSEKQVLFLGQAASARRCRMCC